MAQLSSPGVAVTVIDESFYTPAAPGTTPLIFVTSAENKQNGAGTGTAPGTLKANAGKVYLLTSQKDLSDTFGTPVFKTDANNNPVHAGEQNEFGLQAAYSYLGVSNRAYVVRADIDLDQLNATPDAPAGEPTDGTYWLDTTNSSYGIFEWNSASSKDGGQVFNVKVPSVITDVTKTVTVGDAILPRPSFGAVGDYAIIAVGNILTVWYKKGQTDTAPGWVEVGTEDWVSSRPTVVGTAPGTITSTKTFLVNTTPCTVAGSNVTAVANAINTAAITGVTAAAINGKVEIYSTGTNVIIATGGSNAETTLSNLGLTAGTYKAPSLAISAHTSVPQFKIAGENRPTGSVWVKTTTPNAGANWKVKRYNASTKAFVTQTAPLYANGASALYGLDKAGGGINLALGSTYVKYNVDGNSPLLATFTVYARRAVGATVAKTIKFDAGATGSTIRIAETVVGQATLGAYSGTDWVSYLSLIHI